MLRTLAATVPGVALSHATSPERAWRKLKPRKVRPHLNNYCVKHPADREHIDTTAIMFSAVRFCSLALLFSQVQALYFYMDGSAPKCFFEELPKDTLVVGASRNCPRIGGIYR